MVSPEDEQALDDLLDKIDTLAERICRKAKRRKELGKTPTEGYSSKEMKRTRMAFQTLSEDTLLESRDGEPSGNGAQPAPAPTPAPKKTRFFGLFSA